MATQPITTDFPVLTHAFFCRPAEVVAPELIGCRLVKRQAGGSLLWGVVVETGRCVETNSLGLKLFEVVFPRDDGRSITNKNHLKKLFLNHWRCFSGALQRQWASSANKK